VNSAAEGVIIDTCTLRNFHAVGKMTLLRGRYEGRAHWTPAGVYEARMSGLGDEVTGWLGEAIDVGGEDFSALVRIEHIRGTLGATRYDRAERHLAEAEIIYHIETAQQGWTFISDDQPAIDYARHRGIEAVDTPVVLTDCYSKKEIGCPDAYEVLLQMRAAGRGVRVPLDHYYVCPPSG
jgi:hypothetical protein